MPFPLKVAVLGCGYWGQNLVRNFASLGVLHAVCDPSETGRAKARELSADAHIYSEMEAALDDPNIDAVVIATPAETHVPLIKAAIERGKDVFVEKPLAVHYHDGLAMMRLADQHQRILMVGHLLEYHPAVEKLSALISSGELGKLQYIYSNRLNFGKVRIEENALWSFAPHDIAVILRLMGEEPLEVTCSGGSYLTPNLADVTVSCLHFRTGIRAHVFVSWLNPFKEQKLVVVGNQKMAVFNDTNKDDKLVLFNQHVDMLDRQPILSKGENETVLLAQEEPLRRECQHFLDCIATRSQPLTNAKSAVKVLRVLQACQISLQLNGRPILVSDVREND